MVFVLAGVSGHTQKKDAVEKAALRSLIVVLVLMVIMQLLCSFPHGHQAATLVLLSWSPCMKTPKLLESLTAAEHWALVPSFHNVKGWGFFQALHFVTSGLAHLPKKVNTWKQGRAMQVRAISQAWQPRFRRINWRKIGCKNSRLCKNNKTGIF